MSNEEYNTEKSSESSAATPVSISTRDQELQQVREALRGLRFGNITIVVQDGVIVQIDRTEKRRLRRSGISADASQNSR